MSQCAEFLRGCGRVAATDGLPKRRRGAYSLRLVRVSKSGKCYSWRASAELAVRLENAGSYRPFAAEGVPVILGENAMEASICMYFIGLMGFL